MLNFTGSTKKRVVNLGNRLTTGGGSSGFLEQQRRQREAREKQRRDTEAALVLQRHIRRYLALRRASESLANVTNPIAFLDFVSRWNRDDPRLPEVLRQVVAQQVADDAMDVDGASTREATVVLNACVRANQPQLAQEVVEALPEAETKNYFPGTPGLYPGLIDTFKDYGTLVMAVNVNDSPAAFAQWLLEQPQPEPPSGHQKVAKPYPDAVVDAAFGALAPFVLSLELEPADRVHLLAHYLAMAGHLLLSTVKQLTGAIPAVVVDDDDEEGIVVSLQTLAWVEQLYTPEFLRQMFAAPKPQLVAMLSLLMTLCPAYKLKLCMLVCVDPTVFGWYYAELRQHPLYAQLRDLGADYIPSSEFGAFRNESTFWQTVQTFSDLLQFFLVVLNDYQLQHNAGLFTIESLTEMASFLKHLVLTLIMDALNTRPALKRTSVALLNQIVAANQRLRFLPPDFAHLSMKFDIAALFAAFKSRLHPGDDSDDETTTTAPTHLLRRLEILERTSYFVDFMDRVRLFRQIIAYDCPVEPYFAFEERLRLEAVVRREHVLEDGMAAFGSAGSQFKHKLSIQFTSDVGGREVGIDGGGLTKEFLTTTVKAAFSPEATLFAPTARNQFYPDPDIYYKIATDVDTDAQAARLKGLRYVGMIIGKCLYDLVLVDVPFAPFFIGKWGKVGALLVNDLALLDRELYASLMLLEQMSAAELEELGLVFSVDAPVNGTVIPFPLVPNGQNVAVDLTNRLNYIHQLANFKLNTLLRVQTRAFYEGLALVVDPSWLAMFSPSELQMLVSGEDKVDVDEWIRHSVLGGGYHDEDVTVHNFWEVVREMLTEDKHKLIKFVTLVGRPPLAGFGSLNPPFSINFGGRDLERLPTALTCVNLLKLPDYKDKEVIRAKLLYAINQDAGFDLS